LTWASDIDIDGGLWGSCCVTTVSVSTSAEEAFAVAEGEGVFLPEKQEKQEQQQQLFFVIVVRTKLGWLRMRVGKTKNDESRKTEIWKLTVL